MLLPNPSRSLCCGPRRVRVLKGSCTGASKAEIAGGAGVPHGPACRQRHEVQRGVLPTTVKAFGRAGHGGCSRPIAGGAPVVPATAPQPGGRGRRGRLGRVFRVVEISRAWWVRMKHPRWDSPRLSTATAVRSISSHAPGRSLPKLPLGLIR